MIYLLAFILCILTDRVTPFYRKIFIGIVLIILCFGYTTGSDWVSYELYYTGNLPSAHFEEREKGFVLYTNFFKTFISDFWVFNAASKVFYMFALAYLLKFFTNKIGTAIAFGLVLSTMFMVINCPMRFMIGCSIFYIGARLALEKKWLKASLFLILSLTFHITIIIPILLLFSGRFYKVFFRLSKLQLILIILACAAISTLSGFYIFLFNNILDIIGLGMFKDGHYSFFSEGSLFNIGSLRNLVLALIIIKYKSLFAEIHNGKLIFFYTLTYFGIGFIMSPIPTAFRMIIFNSQLACVALVVIIYSHKNKLINYMSLPSVYTKKAIYFLLIILILKTTYGSYIYYPYTNSIPYIIMGHKSYTERSMYNKRIYQRDIGPIPENENNNNLEKI